CSAASCGMDEGGTGSAAQPERWSNEDRPSDFASHLERRASALPSSGEAEPIPWPGSYWPTSKDSINYRWDGSSSRSPVEKYEAAFGLSGLEDAVSAHYGIDSLTGSDECGEGHEGHRCKKGESCAKRRGATSGRCVPTWFGLCHGWAAAAILFPEPEH